MPAFQRELHNASMFNIIGLREFKKLVNENKSIINTREPRGDATCLMFAVDSEFLDKVKILLNAGADVNLQDIEGDTALHYTAYSGNIEILKLLLENNADKSIRNKDGETALDVAKDMGYTEIALELQNFKGVNND